MRKSVKRNMKRSTSRWSSVFKNHLHHQGFTSITTTRLSSIAISDIMVILVTMIITKNQDDHHSSDDDDHDYFNVIEQVCSPQYDTQCKTVQDEKCEIR